MLPQVGHTASCTRADAHQIVQRLGADVTPGLLQAADQRLVGGGRLQPVELAPHDGPEIFYRRWVRAVARPRALLPERRQVVPAPLLDPGRVVSRCAVLFASDILGRSLTVVGDRFCFFRYIADVAASLSISST